MKHRKIIIMIILMIFLILTIYLSQFISNKSEINDVIREIREFTSKPGIAEFGRIINGHYAGKPVILDEFTFGGILPIIEEHAQGVETGVVVESAMDISLTFNNGNSSLTLKFLFNYLYFKFNHKEYGGIIYLDQEGAKEIYQYYEAILRLEEQKRNKQGRYQQETSD